MLLKSKEGRYMLDNSKCVQFMDCPRAFYYRYIRHWRKEKHNTLAADFGTGWHAMMDVYWQHHSEGDFNKVAKLATLKFHEESLAAGTDFTKVPIDELRNPGLALDMLYAYHKQYGPYMPRYKLISVEQPFVVSLGKSLPDVLYMGRWDKVYTDTKNDKVYIMDHKTTATYRVATKFDPKWQRQWSPNNQIDGYLFAGMMLYPERFGGVVIDGALVHASQRAFVRIPVDRAIHNLDAWLFEIKYWINEILDNVRILEARTTKKAPFLPAFPKKTSACGNYYGCQFQDLCKYEDPNPEKIEEPPKGYVVSVWNPLEKKPDTFDRAVTLEV